MDKTMYEKFKKVPRVIWLLGLIILVGIFLRTYHFSDWMRFSMDQSRDAGIISDALVGKSPLPLMGPDAGNTDFLLGPMYYDLSYISAKIFGNYPDRMAYPSLLAGILVIPFTFLFLSEYFKRKNALALTAVLSVSYFMVSTSRFSSNPNLLPFFLILFLWGLLKILNNPKKFHLGWSALVGFGLGMGIQMHTITLVVMPIIGILTLAYLWKKKGRGILRSLAVVILVAAILNVGQIISESNTHFQNTRNFFQGLQNKSENNYQEGATLISACQVEANGYIISSIGDDYDCGSILKAPKNGWSMDNPRFLSLIIYCLFSFAGYYFLIRSLVKERDAKKKNFLGLVLLFNIITFIILMKVSSIIHVGYYVVLFFVPLVLLGIIMEEVEKKFNQRGLLIVWIAIALLIISSLKVNYLMAVSYTNGSQNNSSNSTLSQGEAMTKYILATIPSGTTEIYFAGQKSLAKRYYSPIEYLIGQVGLRISLERSIDPAKLPSDHPLYYIADSGHTVETTIGKHPVISYKKFFNQTVYILKN